MYLLFQKEIMKILIYRGMCIHYYSWRERINVYKMGKLEGNVGVLTIEVDAKEVNNSIDAFKSSKTINVPGFRKGKMPRPLFEQRFGIESLYQDAFRYHFTKSIR